MLFVSTFGRINSICLISGTRECQTSPFNLFKDDFRKGIFKSVIIFYMHTCVCGRCTVIREVKFDVYGKR